MCRRLIRLIPGERFAPLHVGIGDFCYIAADMPPLPYNRSYSRPVIAVIARTDPNEQESVVLLPELEAGVEWSNAKGRAMTLGGDRRKTQSDPSRSGPRPMRPRGA